MDDRGDAQDGPDRGARLPRRPGDGEQTPVRAPQRARVRAGDRPHGPAGAADPARAVRGDDRAAESPHGMHDHLMERLPVDDGLPGQRAAGDKHRCAALPRYGQCLSQGERHAAVCRGPRSCRARLGGRGRPGWRCPCLQHSGQDDDGSPGQTADDEGAVAGTALPPAAEAAVDGGHDSARIGVLLGAGCQELFEVTVLAPCSPRWSRQATVRRGRGRNASAPHRVRGQPETWAIRSPGSARRWRSIAVLPLPGGRQTRL